MGAAAINKTAGAVLDTASAVLTIDLDALKANYHILDDRCGSSSCAAVVKADAYGTGAMQAVAALYDAGCHFFFVATPDEALEIRKKFDKKDVSVAVLGGLFQGAEADYIEDELIPVLNHLDDVQRWARLAGAHERELPAILHVDTGMNRLGLDASDLAALTSTPDILDGIDLKYIMSHLASSEEPDNPQNAQQLARLQVALKNLPDTPVCFANSSGLFLGPEYIFDLGRPGISLYGGNPTPEKTNPMKDVIRLDGRVLQIRQAQKGEGVGYNATHTLDRDTTIATIGLGYGDGYLRALSGRGHVYFKGQPLPVLGRVSMDLLTVDATALRGENFSVGDYVEVIGPNRPVDQVAKEAGTISYEILTGLGKRYHRVYKGI